jgi:hypothetical protein
VAFEAPVDVLRGFAIADPTAPFIVINDQDARPAWAFTAVHDLAHLSPKIDAVDAKFCIFNLPSISQAGRRRTSDTRVDGLFRSSERSVQLPPNWAAEGDADRAPKTEFSTLFYDQLNVS